jgi:tRNA1(Val) A37 N6-methylase TrmN6
LWNPPHLHKGAFFIWKKSKKQKKIKKKGRKSMQTLCNRCIRALKSRGEAVLIGYEVADYYETCSWCEKTDTELYEVMLNPFGNVYSGT